MAEKYQEFFSLIEKSDKILIVTPPNPSDDQVCGTFALGHLLKKEEKKKEVSILLSPGSVPQKLEFLKKPDKIKSDLIGVRDFLLYFNTKNNRIIDIKTEQQPDKYVIRLTPEKGTIDPKDFSFVPADFNYNLVIVVGATSLDALGKIYQDNTDLFFEVPKINLDNQSANDNFGQVNAVDLTASSVSEILTSYLLERENKSDKESSISQEISQSLLTGIISATESFQTPATTPRTMIFAAQLMKRDADQPTIIRHLYKTKSLSFLKLWGKVMAQLKWDESKKLSWASLSLDDFIQSKATEKDIPFILEEIQKNFSQGKAFAIFYSETPSITRGQIKLSDSGSARKLAQTYDTEAADNTLRVRLENKNLKEAEQEFLEKVERL